MRAAAPVFPERFDDDPKLGPDHLHRHVTGPEVLPRSLREADEFAQPAPGLATKFTKHGMALQRPDGSWQESPVGLEVNRIRWPKGSAFVPVENAIYGVSPGGEGLLYRVDAANGVWSIVRSMDGFDAAGMAHDAGGTPLLMLGMGSAILAS